METRDKLVALIAAVRRYLENPGCNIQAKQKAMIRLAWALEQAEKDEELHETDSEG